MSATNALETAILQLYFNNTNAANIGDATGLRGSTTAGSVYISLHTADPGETGLQTTSETAYTGYARLAVARSGAGWTVAGNAATNAAVLTWGTCTASPGAAITHFGIGSASSGAGTLDFKGPLGASYTVAVSNAPSAAIGAISTTAD